MQSAKDGHYDDEATPCHVLPLFDITIFYECRKRVQRRAARRLRHLRYADTPHDVRDDESCWLYAMPSLRYDTPLLLARCLRHAGAHLLICRRDAARPCRRIFDSRAGSRRAIV